MVYIIRTVFLTRELLRIEALIELTLLTKFAKFLTSFFCVSLSEFMAKESNDNFWNFVERIAEHDAQVFTSGL